MRRLGAACTAAQTHTFSQDIFTQAGYHIGAARRGCSIARFSDTHATSPHDGGRNRAEPAGICRRSSEARERSNQLRDVLEAAARGGSCVDRMGLRRTAHT